MRASSWGIRNRSSHNVRIKNVAIPPPAHTLSQFSTGTVQGPFILVAQAIADGLTIDYERIMPTGYGVF